MAGLTYKDAGVDKEKGYEEVKLIKNLVKKTYSKNVLTDLGGFAGLFKLDLSDIKEPVLISGTDGVGTKIKLAMEMDKHDTVGIDCVAMCVNDIICQGARPLFFLDYIATGELEPAKMKSLVSGVVDGCMDASCALIGGETAEMPGIYGKDDYDLAGFAVGLADKARIITSKDLEVGDVAIAIKSSGLHSNGFSLVRKAMEVAGVSLDDKFDENSSIGEKLLTPTKIYVKEIQNLMGQVNLKAVSNITGGGLYENIPRVLKDDMDCKFVLERDDVDPIFKKIQEWGDISTEEMYSTFNMGLGMVVFVGKEDEEKVLEILGDQGKTVGQVTKGNKEVKIELR